MPITLASRAWALLSRKAAPTAPQATIKISPRTAIGSAFRSGGHRRRHYAARRGAGCTVVVGGTRSVADHAAVQLRRRGPVTTLRSSYDAAVQLRRRGPVTTPRSSYDAAAQLRRRGPVTTRRPADHAPAHWPGRG